MLPSPSVVKMALCVARRIFTKRAAERLALGYALPYTEGMVRAIWTFAELAKRKPVSVAADMARYAIVGTYRHSSGVLCWTTNLTDAEAGATWYRKHGGEVRVVSTDDIRRDDR